MDNTSGVLIVIGFITLLTVLVIMGNWIVVLRKQLHDLRNEKQKNEWGKVVEEILEEKLKEKK